MKWKRAKPFEVQPPTEDQALCLHSWHLSRFYCTKCRITMMQVEVFGKGKWRKEAFYMPVKKGKRK